MNKSHYASLLTIFACMGQGKNHYTKISVNVLIEKLQFFHDIEIKRRWTFQILKNLQDSGLITRRQRYKHASNGQIYQFSSMISLTVKGVKYLVSKKVKKAKKHLRKMMKWITGKDKRWPTKKDVYGPSYVPEDPLQLQALNEALGRVGKSIE